MRPLARANAGYRIFSGVFRVCPTKADGDAAEAWPEAGSPERNRPEVMGGARFMDETPVSRFYRDTKVLEIGEGTSEIQRLVISRELGLPGR
jgi:Acyl-CoA dehydrogenase, C-terminal domain